MHKKSFLHTINLFLRSLLFSIIMGTTIFSYSIICALAMPFPLRYRYAIVVSWTRFMIYMLKVICKIEYKLEGVENIPKNRNGIILSKHQSTWETLFLPGVFFEAAIILKRELLWLPFFGWGLASVDPIAIARSEKTSAMEQIIKKGKACLEAGRWILVFPEGTRMAIGKVGKYHLGGARLAVATQHPVIPVAHNAGRFWPRRKFIKKPGTIRMVIGPLIETTGRKPEEIMLQVKNWIEETIQQIDS